MVRKRESADAVLWASVGCFTRPWTFGFPLQQFLGGAYFGTHRPFVLDNLAIYILDEDEQVTDLATDDGLHLEPPMAPPVAKGDPAAGKRHRKMVRQSRKRNRR